MQPDQDAGDEVARIKALQDNAKRLGLTWERLPGTITSVDPLEGVADGDSEAIGLISMVGPVNLDQRVYIDKVPPGANFISGVVVPAAAGLFACPVTPGTLASSSGTEVAIPAAQWLPSANPVQPLITVDGGWIARVTLTINIQLNAATDSVSIVRVRKGAASTTGTVLFGFRAPTPSSASTVATLTLVGWVKNPGSAPYTAIASVTIQQNAGAATHSLYADTTLPLVLDIERAGLISENPGLAAAAVDIVG